MKFKELPLNHVSISSYQLIFGNCRRLHKYLYLFYFSARHVKLQQVIIVTVEKEMIDIIKLIIAKLIVCRLNCSDIASFKSTTRTYITQRLVSFSN